MAQPSSPPQSQTQQMPSGFALPPSSQNQAQTGLPTGYAACPFCGVQVTQGDYFCRACGRNLVMGARASNDESGNAYGVSSILSTLFCSPHTGFVLGIVALFKGSRSLGCAGVWLSLVTLAITVIIGMAAGAQILGLILPQGPGGMAP